MGDSITATIASAKRLLESLAGVALRRLFGGDAYFVSGVMFAFIKDDALVLRLAEEDRSEVLVRGAARPFLSKISSRLSGWVEVVSIDGAAALIRSAHRTARATARRQSYEQRGGKTLALRRKKTAGNRSESR